MVPGSILGHHTTTIYHYCWNRHPRSAATIEHWLTTLFVDTYTNTRANTHPHIWISSPLRDPAFACRRDTLERVMRVRRLMHRYQVHASQGGWTRREQEILPRRHRAYVCMYVCVCASIDGGVVAGWCECFTCMSSLTPVKWMDE